MLRNKTLLDVMKIYHTTKLYDYKSLNVVVLIIIY